MKQYLEIGKAVSTHGLRGEFNLDPWCDEPEFVTQFSRLFMGEQYAEVKIELARAHKNQVIVKLKGSESLEDARAFIGSIFYILRTDVSLPEGSYFEADLLGLKVYDEQTDAYYGKVTEVFQTGANDVYAVESDSGKTTYIPVIKDVIRLVDIEGGRLLIQPLKGLFDDED